MTLAAFWTGLFDDDAALEAAWALVRGWTAQERAALRRQAPVAGLATPFPRMTLRRIATDAVAIAREGLAPQDRPRIDPFEEIAATGRSPAARWLAAYHGPWQGDLPRAYEEPAPPGR